MRKQLSTSVKIIKEDFGKIERAIGGCLGTQRRRKTQQPAKRYGELEASIDP